MCGQCGCHSTSSPPQPLPLDESTPRQVLRLHQNVLAQNDHDAEHNRALFRHRLVLNVLSSPGSGKTALIQRLLRDRHLILDGASTQPEQSAVRAGVIVGDLASDRDAERLRESGVPAIQITTGNLCHLEAASVAKAAQKLDLENLNLLIIENVGNLVCPAAYDLGENQRIVLMSVTEGEDKPLKYPTMFKSAHVIVISKVDIAEAVEFNREDAHHYLTHVAPQAQIFEVSAKTGQGLSQFYAYLKQAMILQCPELTSTLAS
ncbi:MAG: hydrogenase nickel incorporation protein HypB [Cyanobacteria bacterium P01_A01_bin.37]